MTLLCQHPIAIIHFVFKRREKAIQTRKERKYMLCFGKIFQYAMCPTFLGEGEYSLQSGAVQYLFMIRRAGELRWGRCGIVCDKKHYSLLQINFDSSKCD